MVIAFLVLLQAILSRPHAETLAYSDLKTLLAAGKVRDIVVEQRMISGRLALDSIGILSAHAMRRNLSALPTTDTELKLMAAAAMMGDRSTPKNG